MNSNFLFLFYFTLFVRVGNAPSSANLIQSLLKEGEVTRFSPAEQIHICSILTTADYCLETTLQVSNFDKLHFMIFNKKIIMYLCVFFLLLK